jgi:hypothetical protein
MKTISRQISMLKFEYCNYDIIFVMYALWEGVGIMLTIELVWI